MWHAKPSGGYGIPTSENYDNSMEIYGILSAQGFSVEAVSGVCGNAQAESGLNPWRWQGDTYTPSGGYGLLQWTPSTGYTSLSGATPNFSVSEITQGATPEDGARQIQAFYENNPAKWHSSCWRSYWNTSTYADYYARCQYILATWGSNGRLSLDQFKTINDPYYASDAFLACFEGALVPNYQARWGIATQFYERFTGVTPPEPPEPPEPPTPPIGDLPVWLLKKMADNQNTCLYF